ncbi:MAG TPA: pyridoxamine 5'-phosphate oxidase family protein [Streptosporangiaceae bacterium]|nr:pyridoxamine 5'-phosphate oxidase family protein [Streptosporangiaceae bacterium]
MTVHVESNERAGREAPAKPIEQVRQEVMRFITEEAGFAQVYTVNKDGYPVGRTMVAAINEDWSVDLIQRGVHRRLGQLRRNPHVEITWVGEPAAGSVNDRPHVYDWGLLVPRVVFLRGVAEFMDDDWTVVRYQRQTAIQRAKGLTKAPVRSADNVQAELIGIHVRPVQVRAEGFGAGAQSFTWSIGSPGGPGDGGTQSESRP